MFVFILTVLLNKFVEFCVKINRVRNFQDSKTVLYIYFY